MDYYSRLIEITKLYGTTAEAVIQLWKNIFSRHGIPEEVVTDNGSQFDSSAFHRFSQEYQFRHISSSPYYPRNNGDAERGAKTFKALLKKGGEPYLVLVVYRSTPLSNGYFAAELPMNRKLGTNVPSSIEARKPYISDRKLVVERQEELRWKQR